MRWLLVVLVLMLIGLQYRLWIGEGSLAQMAEIRQQLETQRHNNQEMAERNRILAQEVAGLKSGLEAVEERARKDLGMVARGETFYLVVDESRPEPPRPSTGQASKSSSP